MFKSSVFLTLTILSDFNSFFNFSLFSLAKSFNRALPNVPNLFSSSSLKSVIFSSLSFSSSDILPSFSSLSFANLSSLSFFS